MIPTRAKNVLLLPLADGGVTNPFNMPGHPGYDKDKANHNGLDIGWTAGHAYTNIFACQDGTVMEVFNNNASMGNGVVLQHDYEDGTHRWTSYIHLKSAPATKDGKLLKKGMQVKQGDIIGIRGGSPYINGKAKYGVHLHLYTSKPVTASYTWNTVKANVVDPLPLLYRSKEVKYDTLVGDLAKLPYIEDVLPPIVDPVERDEYVNQLLEKSSKLRVRMNPSLSGTILGYLKADVYYNWYEIVEADGYEWYKIADNQWVAKTSTMVIYPRKLSYDELQTAVTELRTEVDKLLKGIDYLGKENNDLSKKNDDLAKTIKEKEDENEGLQKQNISLHNDIDVLNADIEKLSTKITDAVTVLTVEDK